MDEQPLNIDLYKIKIRLEEIIVKGLSKTDDAFIKRQFQSIYKSKTLVELFQETSQLKKRLEGLGCFKSIQAIIDAGNSPNNFILLINVEEKSPIGGSIQTTIGNNEGNLNTAINFPNVFGKGERISAEYVYGTRNNTDYRLNFSSPMNYDPSKHLNRFSISGFRSSNEFSWSKYTENNHGISFDLISPFNYLFKNRVFKGTHIFSYEGTWRHLISSLDSPFEIREQSGHSVKSSFKYTNEIDRRDNKVLPKSGGFLKTSCEAAGLGGDVSFLKANSEYQFAKTFFDHITTQISLSAGFMFPLKKNEKILINDKFFLGGPLNLRGFTNRGAGPHANDCSLGNDAYWLAGAHIYTPLPFLHNLQLSSWLKTHSFVNIGNLMSLNKLKSPIENCRLSVGSGIVIGFGKMARLELNYAWPIWKGATDRSFKGLQFGIGISFN